MKKKIQDLKNMTLPQREKALEKDLLQLLRARGLWAQKIHSGAVYVKKGDMTYKMTLADQGTPDILAGFRGRFLGIEVKANPEEAARWQRVVDSYCATGPREGVRTMKPSWEREVLQWRQHEAIREARCEALVVSSIEELNADLDALALEYDEEDRVLEAYRNAKAQHANNDPVLLGKHVPTPA